MLQETSTVILSLLILFVEKGIHDFVKIVKLTNFKNEIVNITETFCANKSANFKAIFTKFSSTLFRENS
jgi:hypothetical protein